NIISANANFDLDFGVDADLKAFDLFNLKFRKDLPTIEVPFYNKSYVTGGSSGGTGSTGGTGGTNGTGGTGSTGGTATGQLVIKSGTMSFGSVPANTSASITLAMVNQGNAQITISGVATNSPFSVSPHT